ncbi:hypothetical protein B0H11DRAFT_2045975 [Mycena galericulata]|nr:hypothetical protein B0H11DRAFT_2045975 [Mycena galericulata]
MAAKQPDLIPLVRSTDVWYEDGTVVLQAENTLFRVKQEILAHQSSKFREVLANLNAQPASEGTYDGCPIVAVEASPRHVEQFLLTIHDAGYLMRNPSPVDSMATLSGLLHLANAYRVKFIAEQMFSMLVTIYPPTLDAWLSREFPPGFGELQGDDFLVLKIEDMGRFDARFFTGVFYECCRYPLADIISAEMLHDDQQRCLLAITMFNEPEVLPTLTSRYDVYSFLLEGARRCQSRAQCDAGRLDWIETNGFPAFGDVFSTPFEWDKIVLCDLCRDSAKESYDAGRARLWKDLPSFFDLLWRVYYVG